MLSVTTNCTVFNMLVMLKYISFHFRASLCYTYTILFFLMTTHIFKLLLFAMFGQGNNCIAWVKPRFETAISFYKIFIKTLKKTFRKVSSPTKNPTCFVFSHHMLFLVIKHIYTRVTFLIWHHEYIFL